MSEPHPRLPLVKSRALQISAASVLVVLGVLGFFPLFGGPGYEASLAAGLLLPTLSAIATALSVLGYRALDSRLRARVALGFGIAAGVGLFLVALGVSLLHGLRTGYCDLTAGVGLMVLGPGMGSVMGGAWGAVAGLVVRTGAKLPARRVLAILLAAMGPLTGIGFSLWRFYSSPAVFAFDPFFGFFAGPLYDTVIDPVDRLVSYRAGSLLTLLGLWALSGCVREQSGKWGLRSVSPGRTLAGVAAFLTSFALTVKGPDIGHNTTRASILETLSRHHSYGRCDVYYDPGIFRAYVEWLGRDCHAHLLGLEQYFEVKGPQRVRVLLFASAQQKGRLMGATHTLIAKPWLDEIYLQVDEHPHPILRHELAHVVAGNFGQGPFKIAGQFGGWLPDPGRIEGFAEAAAPREDSDFTLHEWAAAMQEVKLRPPLESIFQLGFLGQNSATAYTVAGAFIAWLKQQHGTRAITSWYAGASLSEVSGGKSLSELERQFHAHLAKVPVSQRLRVLAQARFSVPSIFGRRCPHAVDKRFAEAQQLLGALDIQGAEGAYADVLELDPNHIGARLGLGHCHLRKQQPELALAAYAAVASDQRLAFGSRLGAREAMADTNFLAGNYEKAQAIYSEVLKNLGSEGHRRSLEVKRWATTAREQERRAVESLLLGSFKFPPSWDVAAPELGAWRERDSERGLASYLLGKNLFNRSRVDLSARYLDEALARKLELMSVEREALRLRVIVGCLRNERAVVRRSLERFLGQTQPTEQWRASLRAIAGRCGVR